MFYFTGSLFEQYLVLADYAGESDNEITAMAGETVRLIQKLDSGRTVVHNFVFIFLYKYNRHDNPK